MGPEPRSYTQDHKRQVVDLAANGGRTPTAVAGEAGLHPTLLCRRVRRRGPALPRPRCPSPAAVPSPKPMPVPTAGQAAGWPYMAATTDLHARKVVGWSMRDHLRAELATSAPPMATQRQRPGTGLVQHSDRGVQHACGDGQAALTEAGITPATGRWANPPGDAPTESLLHALETELVHHRTLPFAAIHPGPHP